MGRHESIYWCGYGNVGSDRDLGSLSPALRFEGCGRGETVLLVEDTVAVRDATIMLLEMLGYTVLTAENGASALEVASRGERIAASLLWTRPSAIGPSQPRV